MLDAGRGSYVDVLGVRTWFSRAGAGYSPAVVLIHGAAPGACSQINWHPTIEPLAACGFEVIAFDQPGFGFSSSAPDASLEFRVTHAQAFLDSLGVAAFHLIGNSVGAYIAARLALEDSRVSRLVLVSSSTLAPRGSEAASALAAAHSAELRAFEPTLDSVRDMTLKTLFDPALVTDELVAARLEMSSGEHLLEQRRRASTPAARSLVDELPNITVPTLIAWGNDDRGAAVERGLALLQLIPNAELHVFRNCAHWAQWDQAERFNRLVADFLDAPLYAVASAACASGTST